MPSHPDAPPAELPTWELIHRIRLKAASLRTDVSVVEDRLGTEPPGLGPAPSELLNGLEPIADAYERLVGAVARRR